MAIEIRDNGRDIDDIGAPAAPTNLGNTPSATNVVVTSSTGSPTTIAGATTSVAGVMTGAQVTELNAATADNVTQAADIAALQANSHVAVTEGATNNPALDVTAGQVITLDLNVSGSFTPTGGIVSDNVIGAITELDTELTATNAALALIDGSETKIIAGTNTTVTGNGTTATPYVVNATGGAGTTNLGYTASPTNGIVTSDTGTDATIPLADATNAGLMSPADLAKLSPDNGLSIGVDGKMELGGTLHQATVIDQASNNLTITDVLPDTRANEIHSGDNVIGAGIKGVGFTSKKDGQLSYLFAGDDGGPSYMASTGVTDFVNGSSQANCTFTGTNYRVDITANGSNGNASVTYSDTGAIYSNVSDGTNNAYENLTTASRVTSFGGFDIETLSANGDLRLHLYPETRDDTGTFTQTNVLYTDIDGVVHSAPYTASASSFNIAADAGSPNPITNGETLSILTNTGMQPIFRTETGTNFVDIQLNPATKTGNGGKLIGLNTAETALEYVPLVIADKVYNYTNITPGTCTPLSFTLGTGPACTANSNGATTTFLTGTSIPAPTASAPSGYKWVADIVTSTLITVDSPVVDYSMKKIHIVGGTYDISSSNTTYNINAGVSRTGWLTSTSLGVDINQSASTTLTYRVDIDGAGSTTSSDLGDLQVFWEVEKVIIRLAKI